MAEKISVSATVSLDNPVFRAFVTYAVIVVVKTLLMSVCTAIFRIRYRAFANPEDTVGFKDKSGEKLKVVTHPLVDRAKRCHLNDLENVIPFILIGLLYVTTSPALSTAVLHFRIFVGCRLFHTVAYLLPIPQPARGMSWLVGLLTTLSMAYSTAAAVGCAL